MTELLKKVYASRRASLTLRLISHLAVLLSVLSYALLLAVSFTRSPLNALKLIAITAIPFLLVSAMRRLINAPRPYELYDFYTLPPKEKRGSSFPSRHVFSGFLIATLTCLWSLPLGICLFVCGVLLALSRVLLGIHFIRDCVAGALIGVISGVIGALIASPFV